MMRKLFFPVLILLVGSALGSSGLTEPSGSPYTSPAGPEPAELLYEQTFDFGDAIVGLPYDSHAHRVLADDFELEYAADLDRVVIWGIYTIYQYSSDFMVWLYADSGGMPSGSPLDSAFIGANDITFTDSGYAFGSATIWEIDIPFNPGDEFSLEADTRYWLAAQAQYPYTCYWVCKNYNRYEMAVYSPDDGASWDDTHDVFDYDCDVFIELHGESYPGVTETSWGEIKAAF